MDDLTELVEQVSARCVPDGDQRRAIEMRIAIREMLADPLVQSASQRVAAASTTERKLALAHACQPGGFAASAADETDASA